MTLLGGPTTSQSCSKFFSLFFAVNILTPCDSLLVLNLFLYSKVYGNSNVVSPNTCNTLFVPRALFTICDVTVESFPPLKETIISFISYLSAYCCTKLTASSIIALYLSAFAFTNLTIFSSKNL